MGISTKNQNTSNKIRTENNDINLGPFRITSNLIHEMKNKIPFAADKSTATITNGTNAITFFKNAITFFTTNVFFKSTKFDVESKGDITFKSENNLIYDIKGDVIDKKGRINDEIVKAQQQLTDIMDNALKAQKDAMKSTKGVMCPCEICAQQSLVNKKEGFVIRLRDTVNKYFKWAYQSNAVDTLFEVLNFFYAPILSITDTKGELGGTCGSKGCKNGMIESSSSKIDAGNKAAQKILEENADKITKLEDKFSKSDSVLNFAGDTAINFGPPTSNKESSYVEDGTFKNISIRYKKSKNSPQLSVPSGEGDIKNKIFVAPYPGKGFLTVNVNSKLLLKTGNCGLDILSSGHAHIACGSVLLAATEGEMVVTSANQTTIKGKVVKIDADDRSGSGGVAIKSNHTRVHGALNVDGNATVIGGLSVNGNLCASHIIARSMRMQTGESSSSKTIVNAANWLGTCQAMDVADKTVQGVNCWINPGWWLQPQNIFKTTWEEFNSTLNLTMLEGPAPTGIFMLMLANVPIIGPIWNFKHNHGLTPCPHQHEHEAIKGDYYRTPEDWGGARTDASNIPTPASSTAMGPVPGPRGLGGACGGGGGYNVFDDPNSRASKARRNRNARYGINGDDAYGIYDFVNTTPLSGNFNYDENGDITPKDSVNISLGFDCPSDTNITDSDGETTKKDC
jgi:hypothetical protein